SSTYGIDPAYNADDWPFEAFNGNNYYLPANSLFVDIGSTTADQFGLYHFTIQTNQVIESNSIVDLGYHYLATDANGDPLDSNGNGIPDYLEDVNGNGIVDAGETPWFPVPPTVAITNPLNNTIFIANQTNVTLTA